LFTFAWAESDFRKYVGYLLEHAYWNISRLLQAAVVW
jgi:hypothetical protein